MKSTVKNLALSAFTCAFALGAHPGAIFAQQPAPKPKPAAPSVPSAPALPGAPAPAAAASNIVTLKADSSQADWLKACGKDEVQNKKICYTTRDFVAENNQPLLAAAIYDVVGDPKKFVRFLLPLGFMIQPGIRFSIDNGQPVGGKFSMCLPNGCFAEAESNVTFIDQMKKGKTIKLQVINQVGQEVALIVPLDGFGKAFDGPEVDPAALEAAQKKLQEDLMKRQQGQGAAPGAPAMPAPVMPAPAMPAPAAPKP